MIIKRVICDVRHFVFRATALARVESSYKWDVLITPKSIEGEQMWVSYIYVFLDHCQLIVSQRLITKYVWHWQPTQITLSHIHVVFLCSNLTLFLCSNPSAGPQTIIKIASLALTLFPFCWEVLKLSSFHSGFSTKPPICCSSRLCPI